MSGRLFHVRRRVGLWVVFAAALAGSGTAISDGRLSPLTGNVHKLAGTQFDLGEAPDSLRLTGLDIVFAKTPQQEAALQQLLAAQQDRKSPQYHKWLTAAEYGRRFGASDASLAAATNWLKSNGLAVGDAPPGRGHLPFSGNKTRVENLLHTQIHRLNVRGEQHYANASDPLIPAALVPVVAAIRGLNDFQPQPGMHLSKVASPGTHSLVGRLGSPIPEVHYPGSNQWPGYVGPTDFAIIYNLLPEYQQKVTGVGVTVAIAAQSDLDPSVLTTFWSGFGVSGPSFGLPAQQFSSITVPSADGGSDPGKTNDGAEDEAYLDTEIIGGLAPGAQLLLVRDHNALRAAQYVIDENLAAILNISFSNCESELTASGNTAINSMFEQAAGEGMTVTVSSGDSGVAACTASADIAKENDVKSNGFAVSGIASTPYTLTVGGTDFDPTTESSYWNSSNQTGTLANAISHVPEIAWNDSCANPVFPQFYGLDQFQLCNTADLPGQNNTNPYIDIFGGGGGVSSCTTTDTGGNCSAGHALPSWQQSFGSISGRAIPDVAMIATRWLMCSYDTVPCDPTQAPTFAPAATGTIKVVDGTSAAAPSVAAIIALLDQTQITSTQADGRQGLVNPMLYQLAATQYNNAAIQSTCDASNGAITSSLCIFYDITSGSNAQPCSVANYATSATGSSPVSTCGSESGDATGIMELSSSPSYDAVQGYDLATGLGSINASALIAAVQGVSAPSGLAASMSGQSVTLTWNTNAGATQGYDVYEGLGVGGVSTTPVQQNITGTSTTITGLMRGQQYEFAVASVSSAEVSPPSSAVEVMTVPAAPSTVQVVSAGSAALSLTWNASTGASGYEVFDGTAAGGERATPIVATQPGLTATITALTPGQKYYFTVTALDSGGASAPSTEASGTVVPSSPTGVTATAGNGSVSLSWTSVTGASSYSVYVGTGPNGEAAQPQQTSATTNATVSGLTNGTRYYFTVAAVDSGGAGQPSGEVNSVPVAPSGGGGGGMDWVALGGLAFLLASRARMQGGVVVR
jgi:subtilase family serine protease